MNPYKAPHLILEAVQRLEQDVRQSIKLSFYGRIQGQAYADQLFEQARGLNVFFSQAIYNPRDLCQLAFDICILPSLHFESYSFTASEAIQMELPLIVPDVGVPPHASATAVLPFGMATPRISAAKFSASSPIGSCACAAGKPVMS